MYRPLVIGFWLIVLDQVTKTVAMRILVGQKWLLWPHWGLTYTVNTGIWVNQQLRPAGVLFLTLLALACLLLGAAMLMAYRRLYRRSPWLEWALGFGLALVAGNGVLDRIWVGGARDFLITPIATCNLADLYGNLALLFLGVEFAVFPRARRLLRWGTWAQWQRDGRFVWVSVRHTWRQAWRRRRDRRQALVG